MSKFYTGIGSRQTPADVLDLMRRAAAYLAADWWVLRSGHAAGADRAFEEGADGKAVVYLPWEGFGCASYGDDPGRPVLGRAHVPCLHTLRANYRMLQDLGIRSRAAPGQAVMKLHGRNVCQVLGHAEDPTQSTFVLAWCPEVDGVPRGGTATAVLLARHGLQPVAAGRPGRRRGENH
jgi:hypothetical protein